MFEDYAGVHHSLSERVHAGQNIRLMYLIVTQSNFIALFDSLFWIELKWFVGVKVLINVLINYMFYTYEAVDNYDK